MLLSKPRKVGVVTLDLEVQPLSKDHLLQALLEKSEEYSHNLHPVTQIERIKIET